MPRRRLCFHNLHEALDDARQLAERGYERGGQWSLGQVLDHLNKTLRMSTQTVDFGMPRWVRPFFKWFLMGRMKSGESHAISFRAKAPPSLTPPQEVEVAPALAEFAELVQQIESPDAQFAPVHPILGQVTAEEWRCMQRWHAAHHLSFLTPLD